MGKKNQMNALLVEILIAVLFFALSSTVILEAFVAAREMSREAGVLNDALAEVQNWNAKLYAAEEIGAVLEEEGFIAEGNAWTADRGEYSLEVSVEEEAQEAGALRTAYIRAFTAEEEMFAIPCVRYLSEEVAS